MYSREHAIASLAVGVAGAVALSLPVPAWAAVAWAVVVGVGIDFDHFLVARATTGDWRAARRCLADPTLIVRDQGAIFDPSEITPIQRLLSHVVIAGALVGGLALVDVALAAFTALVLYVHLLADLVWDAWLEARSDAPTAADGADGGGDPADAGADAGG